jgi:hypothetical protein
VLGGPNARKRGTIGFFVPGNHDWGNSTGATGLRRLQNQEEQILAARKTGIPVQLVPPPGTPGPSVRDIRENMRLLMIDTHLYLQEPSPAARAAALAAIEKAIEDAGDRHVLIAAHHPFVSAGPHGEVLTPITKYLGVVYLLQKSGTLVQDLNSPIYRDLRSGLAGVFRRTRQPLAFIGGHDHSLQVHVGKSASDPRYILVSGGGSKSSDLVGADSMRYGTSRPGFMILTFRKRGAVDLFVIAGRDTKTADDCPAPEMNGECMRAETEAYGVVYSERLAYVNPPPARGGGGGATSSRDTSRAPNGGVR